MPTFTLSETAVRKIAADHRRLLALPVHSEPSGRVLPEYSASEHIMVSLDEDIAAADDTDPDDIQIFSGDATPLKFSINGQDESRLIKGTSTLKIYNFTTAGLKATGSPAIIVKRLNTGILYFDGPVVSTIDFTLNSALTTSEASESATIQTQHPPGVLHSATGAGAITVHNHREVTASTYVYEGDSGDYGRAVWIGGTDFAIVSMECP